MNLTSRSLFFRYFEGNFQDDRTLRLEAKDRLGMREITTAFKDTGANTATDTTDGFCERKPEVKVSTFRKGGGKNKLDITIGSAVLTYSDIERTGEKISPEPSLNRGFFLACTQLSDSLSQRPCRQIATSVS